MFEAETARLLEMRVRARGQPLLLAQIDQALAILCRLPVAEDEDLDDLEVAIELLAGAVGAQPVRH